MDPNANLNEQRRLARCILDSVDADDAYRLADLFVSLDEWITGGGFLPDAWWTTATIPQSPEEETF